MDAESIRSEVAFRFSRSSGPGGQHAQKSSTRVEALFHVEASDALSAAEKKEGIAAFFEIAGCFAFWMWLRRGVTPLVALVGIASLVGFAVALTRVDSSFVVCATAEGSPVSAAALMSASLSSGGASGWPTVGDTARAATASGGFASGSQPVIALPDSQPIPKPTSAASASTKYFHS